MYLPSPGLGLGFGLGSGLASGKGWVRTWPVTSLDPIPTSLKSARVPVGDVQLGHPARCSLSVDGLQAQNAHSKPHILFLG